MILELRLFLVIIGILIIFDYYVNNFGLVMLLLFRGVDFIGLKVM